MSWSREATRTQRLVLAGKAAAAGAIAWLLAPYVPFADSEYSYYAPLGVLVSMYPTVAGSARAGVQALTGLGIGIAFGLGALGLVFAGLPAIVAIALVIAVGIVIGGIQALGAGKDWVAIAALFVLLLGGPQADEFSLSYLLTMAFGVVVGIAMNLIVIPPLYLRQASERLNALRGAVCAALLDVAAALVGDALDAERIGDSTRDLASAVSDAAAEVREAEESSRANPRGRRRRGERELNARRLRALDRTTRAIRELADILVHAEEQRAAPDAAMREALADAVRACADLVAVPVGDESAREHLSVAVAAVDRAVALLDRHPTAPGEPAYDRAHAYAAVVCVRRIVDAGREFVD